MYDACIALHCIACIASALCMVCTVRCVMLSMLSYIVMWHVNAMVCHICMFAILKVCFALFCYGLACYVVLCRFMLSCGYVMLCYVCV